MSEARFISNVESYNVLIAHSAFAGEGGPEADLSVASKVLKLLNVHPQPNSLSKFVGVRRRLHFEGPAGSNAIN